MDALSAILSNLRLESSLYCSVKAGAPWMVEVPGEDAATFHVVTAGQCSLNVGGGETALALGAGDVIVLPFGHTHVLSDRLGGQPLKYLSTDLAKFAQATPDGSIQIGKGGRITAFMCGTFRFAIRNSNPILSVLPSLIHVRSGDSALQPWLTSCLQAIGLEMASCRPGAELVVTRLSDVLFVQTLRAYLETLPVDAVGWLGALRDPQIAQALALIHSHAEKPWTVAELGAAVGLSRSHFTARFTKVVGSPPLTYLTSWRMYRARALLHDRSARLTEIAEQVGYSSEAAFSVAFKRKIGTTPAMYRRIVQEAPLP